MPFSLPSGHLPEDKDHFAFVLLITSLLIDRAGWEGVPAGYSGGIS